VCEEIPGRAGHDFSAWNKFIFKKYAFERTTIIHIFRQKISYKKYGGSIGRLENAYFNLFRMKHISI